MWLCPGSGLAQCHGGGGVALVLSGLILLTTNPKGKCKSFSLHWGMLKFIFCPVQLHPPSLPFPLTLVYLNVPREQQGDVCVPPPSLHGCVIDIPFLSKTNKCAQPSISLHSMYLPCLPAGADGVPHGNRDDSYHPLADNTGCRAASPHLRLPPCCDRKPFGH